MGLLRIGDRILIAPELKADGKSRPYDFFVMMSIVLSTKLALD